MKTPELYVQHSGIFIINFKQISFIVMVCSLLTLIK